LKDFILPGVSVTSTAVVSLENRSTGEGGQKKLLCKIEIVHNCIAVNDKESGSLGLYN
jgi:hypothetical protein